MVLNKMLNFYKKLTFEKHQPKLSLKDAVA